MTLSAVLDTIGRVGKFGTRWDEDFYDRLNYKYSVVLLAAYAVVVSTKQYVGNPIVCWCQDPIASSMVDYVHQICWVSNTYYLPDTKAPLVKNEPRENVLSYYQWIPMILLLQALLFLIPHILWRLSSSRSGLDINRIVQQLNAEENLNPDLRDHTVQQMASHIDRSLLYQKHLKTGGCSRMLKKLSSACCCVACGRGYGNYAVTLYILSKTLCLVNSVGQLWLLNSLLGGKYHVYGYEMAKAMWVGKDPGQVTKMFPRVTMCDFTIRQMGNLHPYSVQCLLSVNLFNEKMYVFVWFWLGAVSVASAYGLVQWLGSLFVRSRIAYVAKYIRIMESIRGTSVDKKMLRCFVSDYLHQDGAFILHLLSKNTDDVIVSEIVAALWDIYRTRYGQCFNKLAVEKASGIGGCVQSENRLSGDA